jgi:membrane-associated phospholipid phosphatase
MNTKSYRDFYQKITSPIQSERSRKKLNSANELLTYLFYIAYPALLIDRLVIDRTMFWKILLIPAVSFIVLTIIRAAINAPRPYEKEEIVPLIKKDTKGKSMPSRHVFSAVVIAMSYLAVFPLFGILLLGLAGLSGIIRIIGGVHYPKDVIAGCLCGIVSGLCIFLL